jgi:hypothetical protein
VGSWTTRWSSGAASSAAPRWSKGATTAETINDPIVDVSPAPAAAAKKPNGKLKAAKEVKPTFDDPIPENL